MVYIIFHRKINTLLNKIGTFQRKSNRNYILTHVIFYLSYILYDVKVERHIVTKETGRGYS